MEFSVLSKQAFQFLAQDPDPNVKKIERVAILSTSSWETDNNGGASGELRVIFVQFCRTQAMVTVLFNQQTDLVDLWAALRYTFGTDVEMKVELDLGVPGNEVEIHGQEGMDLEVLRVPFEDNPEEEEIWGAFGLAGDIPQEFPADWATTEQFSGEISISYRVKKISEEAMSRMLRRNFSGCEDSVAKINRKLLEEEVETDVVLVAGNGKEISCHKDFLAGQSEAFREVFQSNLEVQRVTMSDMSEGGVRALLDYLYCGELTQAFENCSLALELLGAAIKFKLDKLEEALKNLVLLKPDNWFTVPVSLKLFQMARVQTEEEKNESFKLLLEKAVAVLKMKPKAKVRKSREFQKLSRNPQTRQQLRALL